MYSPFDEDLSEGVGADDDAQDGEANLYEDDPVRALRRGSEGGEREWERRGRRGGVETQNGDFGERPNKRGF